MFTKTNRCETPATRFGLRDVGDVRAAYVVGIVALVLTYPAGLWYRSFKNAHPNSVLEYL